MDAHRKYAQRTQKTQKTQKRHNTPEQLQQFLEDGAKNAYTRPWHRIERGLRLNRLRRFIEDIAPSYDIQKDEKEALFLYLQRALDKRQLNTLKVVQYDPLTQQIQAIHGLEMTRDPGGQLVYELHAAPEKGGTRKRKKQPSVSLPEAGPSPSPSSSLKMDGGEEKEDLRDLRDIEDIRDSQDSHELRNIQDSQDLGDIEDIEDSQDIEDLRDDQSETV